MRPYIICHMVTSIDGKIDCSMVDKISGDEYYTTLDMLNCPSSLEGRVTMEHYNAEKDYFVPSVKRPAGVPSVHVAQESDSYTITVDTLGRLRWPSAEIGGEPLICIVSEQATEEYLETLRIQGISWIAVGEKEIDLPRAMEILHDKFGVKRLALLGGGNINGGFLKAGLIDEISLLVAPGIDGRKGQTTLFDGLAGGTAPVNLQLKSFKKVGDGTMWLRYTV